MSKLIQNKNILYSKIKEMALATITNYTDNGGKLKITLQHSINVSVGQYVRIFDLPVTNKYYDIVKVVSIENSGLDLTLDIEYSSSDVVDITGKECGIFRLFESIYKEISESDCPFVVFQTDSVGISVYEMVAETTLSLDIVSETSASEINETMNLIGEDIAMDNLKKVLEIVNNSNINVVAESCVDILGATTMFGFKANINI